MKRLRPITLIFALLVAATLVWGPGVLRSEQAQNRFYEWLEGDKPQWTGILELWHIVEWRTGGDSGVAYLNDRASAFESRTPGVFIETTGMTAQEAKQRLQSGERPDLVSFPTGYEPPMQMKTLTMPENVRPALAQSALVEGEVRALPYMYGGYMLIANRTLFLQMGMDLPLDGEWDPVLLSETIGELADAAGNDEQEIYGLVMQGETWTLPQNALLLYAGGRIVTDKARLLSGGLDTFLSGQGALLVASQGDYKAVLDAAAESGISYQVYPLTNYTDMVQYVGVCMEENQGKMAVGETFGEFLLTEANQKRLAPLGVFSALEMDIQDGALYEVETVLLAPQVPPAVQWGQVFADISELSRRSLWDEEAAQSALWMLEKTLSH